ncbi:TetR/AcrR family transcriptional regulator [Streptomyces sp. yr375]|uniref:TetR/AcrR family transcriptional regulator n=1 Tax=Streptomyces sp. yr375 TaxID=1761906 RepID=UPI0015A5827D|nr:TetR/AcrR family transcriptional regulator [Streptomyces sp. yr375]
MSEDVQHTKRRDAARNRERLLTAAHRAFAEHGPGVAFEAIARAADVSRTTLYRNFATRQELAATVYEDNVARIEQHADALGERADGVVRLLDFVLDMQRDNRSLAHALSGADVAWLTGLSARTVSAFRPHLERGRAAGLVHPEVDVQDLMLAFPMAAGAMADDDVVHREQTDDRVRTLVHRALFTDRGRPG